MARLKTAAILSACGASLLGLFFASTQIQAASDGKSQVEDVIAKSIIAQYPSTKIDSIQESPMEGIYEIVMGKNIAYTNSEGRYFLFGHLFDMQTQTDITADNKKSYAKIEWDSLNLENALVFKNGNGSKKLAMVTDIDCGYCRMLEQELSKLDDVTIYKFLTPIQGGYTQSVSIWCAADRNSAYLGRILEGRPVPEKTCKNPVDDNLQWFESRQLAGTPVLIKPDGEMFQGYAQLTEIEGWLQ